MPSFGEYLKRERELREISLREISDETKISYRYLEALEDDNVSKLPAEVFIKGFIRSYANHIGLDSDEAILRYQEHQKTKEVVRAAPGSTTDSQSPDSQSKEQVPWLWILLGLFVIGVLVFGYRLWAHKQEGAVVDSQSQAQTEQTVPPSPDAGDKPAEVEEVPQVPVAAPLPVKQDPLPTQREELPVLPLDVTLYAKERTWLAFDVDDRQHYDVTLQVGEEIHFRMADTLRLTVGNAGGLYVRSKSRTLGPLGESGQVVKNFVLTRKDLVGDSPGALTPQ